MSSTLTARLLAGGALLVTLIAAGILIAASGGDGDGDATTASTSLEAKAGSGGVAGEDPNVEGSNGPPRSDSDESDGTDGGGPQEGQGPADAASLDDGFAAKLRAIVAGSLAELAPLAQGSAAAGDPEQYADLLATGASQIDDTLGELETLDAPPEAEEGTQQVIDAYRGLHEAVARGAKDFSSGNRSKITAALGYLGEAAGQFRADLGAATSTLGEAGFVIPVAG